MDMQDAAVSLLAETGKPPPSRFASFELSWCCHSFVEGLSPAIVHLRQDLKILLTPGVCNSLSFPLFLERLRNCVLIIGKIQICKGQNLHLNTVNILSIAIYHWKCYLLYMLYACLQIDFTFFAFLGYATVAMNQI